MARGKNRGLRYDRPRSGDMESAAPSRDRSRDITPSDVARTRKQSGPVKRWSDMSEEEREVVRRSLGSRG